MLAETSSKHIGFGAPAELESRSPSEDRAVCGGSDHPPALLKPHASGRTARLVAPPANLSARISAVIACIAGAELRVLAVPRFEEFAAVL